ncbi:hypothetical protein BC629DRAFT_1728956 [Irpex lacteus]|nr:hypothetical protein BC629DRAFT_1728956 [Irpex lacteus]
MVEASSLQYQMSNLYRYSAQTRLIGEDYVQRNTMSRQSTNVGRPLSHGTPPQTIANMPDASVDPFIWTNNALLGDIPPKYGSNMSKSGLFLRITEAETSHPPKRSRLFSLDNPPPPSSTPEIWDGWAYHRFDNADVVKTNDGTQAPLVYHRLDDTAIMWIDDRTRAYSGWACQIWGTGLCLCSASLQRQDLNPQDPKLQDRQPQVS